MIFVGQNHLLHDTMWGGGGGSFQGPGYLSQQDIIEGNPIFLAQTLYFGLLNRHSTLLKVFLGTADQNVTPREIRYCHLLHSYRF